MGPSIFVVEWKRAHWYSIKMAENIKSDHFERKVEPLGGSEGGHFIGVLFVLVEVW